MRKASTYGLIAAIIFIALLSGIKTTYFTLKAVPAVSPSVGEELPPSFIDSDEALAGKNIPASFSGKVVALTFDDGPHPVVTKRILEILERHNAKATDSARRQISMQLAFGRWIHSTENTKMPNCCFGKGKTKCMTGSSS